MNNDAILLESVKTHRARLRGAFLIGELAERRDVNDNVRRLIGSIVLTAVICAGCVGTSFVLNAINAQATQTSTTGTTATDSPTPVPAGAGTVTPSAGATSTIPGATTPGTGTTDTTGTTGSTTGTTTTIAPTDPSTSGAGNQ